MTHNNDWSQSHNGIMVGTFAFTRENMPEVTPILDELLPLLESNEEDYLVDVKVHMLMPNQIPCIPNWHYDFLPRDEDNKVCSNKRSDKKMFMWISGAPLTEYKSRDGVITTKPAQQWHSFTQSDLHRGSTSQEHTWRCFIRVLPKEFLHAVTLNVGTIRRHTQVYLNAEKFRW
jgi:hypothetical protein